MLTLPCSAAVGALTYGVVSIFGDGAAGPIVVAVLLLTALGAFAARRARNVGADAGVIGDILEVIWSRWSPASGSRPSYSFVVLGVGRSAEARRSGQSGVAIGYGALAAFFLIVFLGGFVFAIQIMLTKARRSDGCSIGRDARGRASRRRC